MAKMCWKCGKYHEDGIESCPFCGASFTSGSERYESDGRTISNKDETAYLNSPPPKYRRQHVILPVAIIGALIVAMVFVVAQGYVVNDNPDVRYNYSMYTASELPTDTDPVLPDEGMQFVIMRIVIINDSISSGVSSDIRIWDFSLYSNNNWYEVDGKTKDFKYYQEPIVIQKGGSTTFYEVFQIPSGSSVIDVSLDYQGDGKVSRDNHILMI